MARNTNDELAQIEKLEDSPNYVVWKFKISIVLKAQEIYQIATEVTADADKNAAWTKRDAGAQKVIATTIDKKPLMHILNCGSSLEMWNKLKTIYEKDSNQQKCNLLQEVFGMMYDKKS